MPGGVPDPEWKTANRHISAYRAFSTASSSLMDKRVKMTNRMITKLSAKSDKPKKGLSPATR